jgi:hypothetical protein
MDDIHHQEPRKGLDHIAYRNRQSLIDWEERLWQWRLRGEYIDPRDEIGRRQFRSQQQRIASLRGFARELHNGR